MKDKNEFEKFDKVMGAGQEDSNKDRPDDLDSVVRQIFEITSSHYWEDRATQIASLIKVYCSSKGKI